MQRSRGPGRLLGDRCAPMWRRAERVAWSIGVVCVSYWCVVQLDRVTAAKQAVADFTALQAAALKEPQAPDQSLWSPQRIVAWRTALKDPSPVPLAILRIPRIQLEVPVLEGTDDITLDRGAGHIDDTARPGNEGNIGIAGHRDGYFRGLKDVGPGDAIELETLAGREVYRIERTWIVDPEDVSVLDPTPTRSLTLVTCYPFYFAGSAPKRFIVRAVIAEAASKSVDRPR